MAGAPQSRLSRVCFTSVNMYFVAVAFIQYQLSCLRVDGNFDYSNQGKGNGRVGAERATAETRGRGVVRPVELFDVDACRNLQDYSGSVRGFVGFGILHGLTADAGGVLTLTSAYCYSLWYILWRCVSEAYCTGSHFQTQMSAKQSKIEKLKLEIRKLEAERDGLKQVQNYAENG